MKAIYILTSLLLCTTVTVEAQIWYSSWLDQNNIKAWINSRGDLFRSPLDPGFEVPIGSGKSVVFDAHIWMAGLDATDSSIHVAAQKGMISNSYDFWPGPIATTYDSTYDANYNGLWRVSETDIQNHITGTVTSQAIMDWPAHGNVANGEAANLAPFVDVNNNGLYEPMLGDYPKIRGDQAVFTIFNDARDLHTASGGLAIGVEVHCMLYAYSSVGGLYNTVFVNYNIFNRSNTDYSDFYVGQYADTDVGISSDDYVGCSPSHNTYYGYNGDPIDDNSGGSGGGAVPYGPNPPAVGVTFLNEDLWGFMYFNNVQNITFGDPINDITYYRRLQGLWGDGSPLFYGGNGHVSGGGDPNVPTRYAFDGDPTDSTQWHEGTANGGFANPPGDRRCLGVIEPITFQVGESICLDLAYTYHQSSVSNVQAVTELLNDINLVQAHYDGSNYACGNGSTVSVFDLDRKEVFRIYPNPARNQVSIDLAPEVTVIQVLDVTGKIVLSQSVEGQGTYNMDLASLPSGVYLVRGNINDRWSKAQKLIKYQ